jgi:RimJ/RimL family protein N-acetyltransferase
MFIIEHGSVVIGCMRFDPHHDSKTLEASIYLRQKWCGKGHGPEALSIACELLSESWPDYRIIAKFRPENENSRRAFSKAGFVKFNGNKMLWVKPCA